MGSKKRKRKEREQFSQKKIKLSQEALLWKTKKAPLWQYLIPPIILSFLTTLFYAPSIRYDFQFDDIANIKKLFLIRHYTIGKLFFTGPRWISYWLNSVHYSINEFNPISYRIGNLIIHLISGVLVFFILFTALRHLKQKNFFTKNYFSISFLTSLLFLLHPVQTQTVSYVIQGQLEGLAGLCILGMTFFFLKASYANTNTKKYLYIFLLFIVAIFSCGTKEIAIISPAMLLLVDWFLVAQGNWKSLKKRLYIHIPLALLVFSIYIYFLKPKFFTDILGLQRIARNNPGNIITQNIMEKITPGMFLRSQFKVILHYLWMFIYPLGISVEYDWVLSKSFFAPDCIFPFIALLIISFLIIKLLIKNRASIIAFGALWFFLAILPRSSIIPSPELLVDYKTYTASFGWLFLIASFLIFVIQKIKNKIIHPKKTSHGLPKELTQKLPGKPFHTIPDTIHKSPPYWTIAASLLIAISAGFLTMQRNTIWRSGLEFWGDMVKKAPGKARTYNNYGVELSQEGAKLVEKTKNPRDSAPFYKKSIPHFKKAIQMDRKYPDPWNNLSVAYASLGELDKAIDALKESIRIYPYHPETYNNLASFYIQKNDLNQAEKLLKTAIRLRPYYGKAHFNMGRVFFTRGQKEEAWKWFKKCCSSQCDFDNVPHGFSIYAQVSINLKKYDDAIFGYKKVLSFNPQNIEAIFNLATAYFMATKYDNAIILYNQIVKNDPRHIKTWYNLGETYVCLKKYNKALKCYQKAKGMSQIYPYFNLRLANCLEKMGKIQEAQQALKNLISINSNNNQQIASAQTEARYRLAQLSNNQKAPIT